MTTDQNRVKASYCLVWLKLVDLEMAPIEWGRPVRRPDVRSIGQNFDPDLLGLVVVWERTDRAVGHGRFMVLDGQHRVRALVDFLAYLDQKIQCMVYRDITPAEAAAISLGLQERRNLHPYDHHRAAVAAGVLVAIRIEKTAADCGITVVRNVNGPSEVSAISTMRDVMARLGPAGLGRVLEILSGAWDRTPGSYASKMMRLAMMIVAVYDTEIDDTRLALVLGARSPNQWVADTLAPKRHLGFVAQDVVLAYNHGLRAHRIDERTPNDYVTTAKRVAPARGPKPKIQGRTINKGASGRARYGGTSKVAADRVTKDT
jgi:hypothetical protein